MGSLTLAYPSIAGKTTQEQLESMRRYLCSVTEQLNLADWSAKATLTDSATQKPKPPPQESTDPPNNSAAGLESQKSAHSNPNHPTTAPQNSSSSNQSSYRTAR